MNIKKFLLENEIQLKKSWDQFFLINESVLEKEIELADLKKDDIVLEIGAGFGNLTKRIAKHSEVIAIEKDGRFEKFLNNIGNTEVIIGDAIFVLNNYSLEFNKIISNIPYNISQKIILSLLKHKWGKAVLIVQNEFAEKMERESKLSLIIKDCCEYKIMFNISGKNFYPEAVDSSLVVLEQKKTLDKKFLNFLNKIYKKRNKDVKNVVEKYPEHLAKRKINNLNLEQIKIIYEMNK